MPDPGSPLKSRVGDPAAYNERIGNRGEHVLLIVPLHRSLNAAHFPFVTAALILINCFVYVVLQGGDARIERRAFEYYRETGLQRIEFPAFAEWLRTHGRSREGARFALAAAVPELAVQYLQADHDFLAALHADRVIAPDRPEYPDWREHRGEFERILAGAFTDRYDLHYSEFSPKRLIGSMFLHGSAGHLIGNMVFLALLGLLVEGALGPALMLALYLLGGLGAALASLAWRWGDVGSGLGASGAIAGLMGAYCVLWGLRKVRVFYWFFVVFDYVRVPALLLLPLWLGWELWQLLTDRSSHIAFDEHAGGIVCGAALAWGVRRLGWQRDEFLAEDERSERRASNAGRLQTALDHLGRLEIAPARQLLRAIDMDEPGQLPVLVALYRCAAYAGTTADRDAAAARVFAFDARAEADVRELHSVYADYAGKRGGRVPAQTGLRLLRLWQRIGADGDAERLLRELAARAPHPAGVDAAWYAFAQSAPENSPLRRERLQFVTMQFPQSEFAKKAAFLLSQA